MVRLIPLTAYRKQSRISPSGPERIMSARLNAPYRHLIPPAISYGMRQLALPYDSFFMPDQAALYCSELIVDMFRHANGGAEFFRETPMSFSDPVTGEILPGWINYYEAFGLEVPEDEPGSHPGEISLDPRITIYDVTEAVPGYQP